MIRASHEQLAESEQALAAVCADVNAYVLLLRALDTSPEETVVDVKAVVGRRRAADAGAGAVPRPRG